MSHDGKGLSALYARDLTGSSASGDSKEVEKIKRSRFDDVEDNREKLKVYRCEESSRDDNEGRKRERSRDTSEYKRHRDIRGDRERDRERYRDSYSRNDRERDFESYDRRDRERESYSRSERYRESSISTSSRGYDQRGDKRTNVEIPFDKFLRLSPWRGPVTPLEERVRHLKNWDVAPTGFERISADKAKMTGLFAPPGNIAKQANYVPPTLDPARAAMLQLLNKDPQQQLNYPQTSQASSSSADSASASVIPAHLVKQAKRFYLGNLPFNVNETGLLNFLESNLSGLSGSGSGSSGNDCRVHTINISTDRSYAFIECKTIEDATLAMNLDGVIYDGSQLKVRRPKEYHIALITGVLNGSTTGTSTSTSTIKDSNLIKSKPSMQGVPDILTSEHVRSLLLLIADLRSFILLNDRESDKSLGVAIFEFIEDSEGEEWSGPFLRHSKGKLFMGPFEMKIERVCDLLEEEDINDINDIKDISENLSENVHLNNINLNEQIQNNLSKNYLRNLLSYYNLLPIHSTAPTSTPILQLLNIVTRESLQGDYENIYQDLKQEILKHTPENTFELKIPRPPPIDEKEEIIVPGIGKVFIKFGSVEEAARMANEVAGRIFDGKTCIVSFYSPEKYEKGIF